ncbi:hypothetical protein [Sinomicrobium sp. M5D2P17]
MSKNVCEVPYSIILLDNAAKREIQPFKERSKNTISSINEAMQLLFEPSNPFGIIIIASLNDLKILFELCYD